MMNNTDNPLKVLLQVKSELDVSISDEIVERCYALQRDQQYDRDRDTLRKMRAIIEEYSLKIEGDTLI